MVVSLVINGGDVYGGGPVGWRSIPGMLKRKRAVDEVVSSVDR